jgi:hypothetical protein
VDLESLPTVAAPSGSCTRLTSVSQPPLRTSVSNSCRHFHLDRALNSFQLATDSSDPVQELRGYIVQPAWRCSSAGVAWFASGNPT